MATDSLKEVPDIAGGHTREQRGDVSYQRIIRVSLPMVASAVAAVVVQVVVLALIGHMGGSALYVRSVYTPVSYLFLAMTIGLAVTVQVAVARACGRGDRQASAGYLGSVARVAVAVFAVLGGLLMALAGPLSSAIGVSAGSRGTFHAFLAAMTAATLLGTLGELCSAVLRGAGRTGIAAMITATYVAINLGMVSAALALHHGLMVVPVAAGAGGAVEIALGLGALVHLGLVRPGRLTAWCPDTWLMLSRIGLPVGMTSVVLAVVNLLLLRIVAPAGQQAVAGFNVGFTIQSAVIVPAVGLGSAISILMNQSLPEYGLGTCRQVFRRGLLLATAGYASVTVAMVLLGGPLAGVMSGDPAVAEQARHFISIVGPTFGCTGLTLVALTILEQVGHGLIAVLMNSGYFAVVLGIGSLAVHAHHQVTALYWTMAIAAVTGLVTGLPITARKGMNPRVLRR